MSPEQYAKRQLHKQKQAAAKRFGERLNTLMQINGDTIYDIAADTNVTYQNVSQWRLGHYIPRIERINRLANHYGVSCAYLLGESDEIWEFGR